MKVTQEQSKMSNTKNYDSMKKEIMESFATTGYQKTIIMLLDDMDVVKALNIIEHMQGLFEMKFKELTGEPK